MKIYVLPDATECGPDEQFVIGNQSYGGGWLRNASADELRAAGITVRDVPDPVLPPQPVPVAVVTMRQARLALLSAGLLDQINAAVKVAGDAAGIEWEYAGEVRRDSPLIAQLAAGLKLSDEQIDDLFAKAGQIE